MNAATLSETAVVDLQMEPREANLPATQARSNQPHVVVTPADLLRIAMETDSKDLDRLERLMAMDERYRESQERDRQRAAMLAFRADFVGLTGENIIIPKTKHVDRGRAGSFDQAEFDEVKRRLSPACAKHGFGFRHDQRFGVMRQVHDGVESDVPWVWVTCFLEHRAGHSERLDLEGPPGDLSANTAVQNMQATASYLKRVSLLAITGTATGGEDDEAHLRDREGGAPLPAADAAPTWPDEPFETQFKRWKKAVEGGLKTAADIETMALTKGALTEQQQARIRALTVTGKQA